MAVQVVSKNIIWSRRASYVPGDTLRELTRPATDTEGRTWPKGSKFQPQSFGIDNTTGSLCQRVVFVGRERSEATFVARAEVKS